MSWVVLSYDAKENWLHMREEMRGRWIIQGEVGRGIRVSEKIGKSVHGTTCMVIREYALFDFEYAKKVLYNIEFHK